MARVRIGLTCNDGHFNYFGDLWEPVKDKDIDKLAERSMLPTECEEPIGDGDTCGHRFAGLPHVEGREREADQLARVGGRNVHKGLEQKGPKPRKRGPLTDGQLRQVVFDRQRERPGRPALCAVSGRPLSWQHDDCHHVLDKRLLHARGEDHVANDARNAIFIKADVHAGHTSGLHRITRDKIPPEAWAYAHERGPWAVQRLEADYPAPK
jgi:hypothetical protein